MSEWVATGFTVKTDCGPREIAGWVKNDLLALDFRVWDRGWHDYEDGYDKGWMLTHLPTGYQICGLLVPLVEAFPIADRFMSAADWGFDKPEESESAKAAVTSLKAEFGDILAFRRPSFTPLFDPRQPS